MEIKVLGTGCDKCRKTYALIEKLLTSEGIEATLTKVEDMAEIADYGVMRTPAVVVDNKVKLVGKVPREDEILKLLGK